MSDVFLGLGGGIFLFLGAGHGVLSLLDLYSPTFFTPVEEHVRDEMAGTAIALNRRASVWRAWLGFNLSHSLGMAVFGIAALWFATRHHDIYAASGAIQLSIIWVSVAYLLLSVRFWFWGPVIGSTAGATCLVIAALLV